MTGYVHAIHRRYVHAKTGTCTDDRVCQGTCTPLNLVRAVELRVRVGGVDLANPNDVPAGAVCSKAPSAEYNDFERIIRPRTISTTSNTFTPFTANFLYRGSPHRNGLGNTAHERREHAAASGLVIR